MRFVYRNICVMHFYFTAVAFRFSPCCVLQKRYAASRSRNANRNSRCNINMCCDRCFAESLSEHFPALPKSGA